MKKIGILLTILLVAGAYAMADETAAAQGELFADVGAAALSRAEMEAVDGGMGVKEFYFKANIKDGIEVRVVRDAELARVDHEIARENRETRRKEIAERRERRQKKID